MEALSNWYPDETSRGIYDINDKLEIEAKAVEIWKAGYLNALVPSDLIVNKTITVGQNGKALMNGHVFDAVLYLNPQYAREPVLKFLEAYEKSGGKLMIEGRADRGFDGEPGSDRFEAIYKNATIQGYSVANLARLGLQKNYIPDGCKNEDGSYVFTDMTSLRTGLPATFSINIDGDVYSGEYMGLAAIDATKKEGLQKFAAAGFKSLARNGRQLVNFAKPMDVYIETNNNKLLMTIADTTRTVKPLINDLKMVKGEKRAQKSSLTTGASGPGK
jgi:hypothetical protein